MADDAGAVSSGETSPSGGTVPAGAPPHVRAEAWVALAQGAERGGHRSRALVAARTALALLDRAGAEGPGLEAARRHVAGLTGPDVVPLHVDMGGGAEAGAPPGELRAVWLGAPAHPVLAMAGLLERDGALDVVRVVVPGTRRGRAAFALLVDAMPPEVTVEMALPARDPALLRLCRRAGFDAVDGSLSGRGHVGGSLRVRRDGGAR